MLIHPRLLKVQGAHAEFGLMAVQFAEKQGLTDIEMVKILLQCALEFNMLALRAERHPEDPTRKADEA